jgi:hypothetical protein
VHLQISLILVRDAPGPRSATSVQETQPTGPMRGSEATTTPKQSAYPRVQDPAATRDKPAMTADEQAKLKKDLIEARDRQSSKAKQGATRPQPIKP